MPFEPGKIPEGATPFLPGNNANPNGRPVGSKNRSTIAKKWLEVERNERNPLTGLAEKLSYEDIITLTQIKKAQYDEDTLAYKALMDSAYGAPKQEHDMDIKAELNIPAPIVYNQSPPLVNSENDVDNV
jgi:hypothetical protein